MGNLNHFSGVVKILETPKELLNKKRMGFTKFRAELPQTRKTIHISVVTWGNLSRKICDSYKKNDYILIEGYLSFRTKNSSNRLGKSFKSINVTGLKIYPILLSSKHDDYKLNN